MSENKTPENESAANAPEPATPPGAAPSGRTVSKVSILIAIVAAAFAAWIFISINSSRAAELPSASQAAAHSTQIAPATTR